MVDLRRRATEALTNWNRATVFVEFAGTPKSGKSTCIDTLGHFFRGLNYKVLAPTEGASKRTPYYLKQDLVSFNVWSASYAVTHILEGLHGSDRYHIALLDRGLFDALAWFELLCSEGDIDQTQRDTIQRFLLFDKWRKVIDGVFLFQTDPTTSLERENQGKLITDPGRAMNPYFLGKLNSAYDSAKDKFAAEFKRFFVIDTSEDAKSTSQSTASEVAGKIVDVIREKVET